MKEQHEYITHNIALIAIPSITKLTARNLFKNIITNIIKRTITKVNIQTCNSQLIYT